MSWNVNDIDCSMNELVRLNEMAGAALIVRKDGEEVYRGKWGYADIKSKIPVQYNTIYRLASMSKPITAVAVMQLVEQGKLNLEDPISKYLPAYEKQRVCNIAIGLDGSYRPDPDHPAGLGLPELLQTMKYELAKRPVTVRDLISHSSGMGMGPAGIGYIEHTIDSDDNLEIRVDKWAELPLDFQPGEATGYSPMVGFDILGRIIEIITELDYQQYLQENICKPLKIKDITFSLSEEQQNRVAKLYQTKEGNHIEIPEGDDLFKAVNPINGYFSGAGGMFATVEAYDRFTSMLANGGEFEGSRIIKRETIKEMQCRGAYDKTLETMPGAYWGLGMLVMDRPELLNMAMAPGTYGWSGAYGTHMFVSPETGLSATFVMNRTNIGGAGSPIARKIEELVFGIFE
jgi:CubicO group peptidase (beta-lactamase class C family)